MRHVLCSLRWFVAAAAMALSSSVAWAQPNGEVNGNFAISIPTLDGMGIVVLAGAVAATGTYFTVRARARRDRDDR